MTPDHSGQTLSDSSVAGAHLEEARFLWADLSNVDFREAHLNKCEMAFAGLSGTNFTTGQLAQIAFTPLSLAVTPNFDLSKARIEQRYSEFSSESVGPAIEILEHLLSRLKEEPKSGLKRFGNSRGAQVVPASARGRRVQ